ncbi:hypothetical protein MRX96_058255 [Rhipicephalus microplus]
MQRGADASLICTAAGRVSLKDKVAQCVRHLAGQGRRFPMIIRTQDEADYRDQIAARGMHTHATTGSGKLRAPFQFDLAGKRPSGERGLSAVGGRVATR